MHTQANLCLASSSPRRQEILRSLGLQFSVQHIDIDETRLENEAPEQMVLRLAIEKAGAANNVADGLVIAADTAVVADRDVLGKPVNEEHAIAMLMSLSGRGHRVLTGVALCSPQGVETMLSTTCVRFRDISPDEARAYWQSGEPRDKAGAYAIQGIGGAFVEAIDGSYSGVVGLPVFETSKLLSRAGIDILPK